MKISAIDKIVLFVLLFSALQGQHYLIHTYTIENGLPSNYVNDIVQDNDRLMWFLTNNGIASYNGQKWQIFTSKHGLEPTHYLFGSVDTMNNIWAVPSSLSHHIMYFNGNKWIPIPSPDFESKNLSRITAFAICKDNPAENGMVVGTESDGLFVYKNGLWHKFIHFGRDSLIHINSVSQCKAGKFIISTRSKIYAYENDTLKELKENKYFAGKTILKTAVHCSPDDENTSLWVVGRRFVATIRSDSLQYFRLPKRMVLPEKINCLFPWGNNRLLIGSFSSLLVLDVAAQKVWPISKKNGLVANGANSCMGDFEHNIWVACNRGVSKLISRRFETFRSSDGLLEDEVTAVQELRKGVMVLGHTTGFTILEKGKSRFLRIPTRKYMIGIQGRILDMAKGSDGNLYAISHLNGLYKIDQRERLSEIKLPKYIRERLSCVLAEEDGLWIGSGNHIYKINYKGIIKLHILPTENVYIRRLFHDNHSNLVVATKGSGLLKISPGENRRYFSTKSLESRNVYSYRQLEDQTELVGCNDGIYKIQGDSLVKINPHGSPFTLPIYFIVQDSEKNIWLGTDAGVYKWNRSEFRNYAFKHGLAGFETNRAAGFIDSEGKLWIGTESGVSAYYAQFDEFNLPPPHLTLKAVVASGTIASGDKKELHFPSSKNSLDFIVNCISFLNEHDISVKYRLTGFEAEYHTEKLAPGLRFLYPNLKPGNYRFEIRAINTNGTESEPVFSPEIIINKPYYAEWWFYLLVFLLIFSLTKLVIKYYSQQIYSHRLEEEVRHRTQLLWDTETRYKTLFQESKDTVLILNGTGKLLDINEAGVKLLGFDSKEEMLSNFNLDEFVLSHEVRDKFYLELVEKGAVKDFEMQIKNLRGQILQTLVTAISKKSSDNTLLEIRGIIRDESRRKELEKQVLHSQKMESIGTLAGGIAHDFNNILAGMLGYTSLIKLKFPDKELIDDFIEPIEKGASRASELTSQLLAFARGGKYDVKPIGLNYIIKDVVKIIQSTFPKNIDIITDLFNYLPTIEADPSQIQQVIMNLCVNARDAMPEGGTLTIKTDLLVMAEDDRIKFKEIPPGKYVHMTVSDTGTGISEDILDKIFEPFFTTKDSGKGTGLGLAMVYGVVRNHDGSIEVSSTVGKGTSLEIVFPVSAESMEIEEEEEIPIQGSETILLVDDEEDIRGVLKNALELFGYTVILAEDGLEAIKRFSDKMDQIDLVIMDIMMPKMSGDEAVAIIKEMKPDIKILISSGFLPDVKVRKLFEDPSKVFVQKPFKANVILSKIREILDEEPINNDR